MAERGEREMRVWRGGRDEIAPAGCPGRAGRRHRIPVGLAALSLAAAAFVSFAPTGPVGATEGASHLTQIGQLPVDPNLPVIADPANHHILVLGPAVEAYDPATLAKVGSAPLSPYVFPAKTGYPYVYA